MLNISRLRELLREYSFNIFLIIVFIILAVVTPKIAAAIVVAALFYWPLSK